MGTANVDNSRSVQLESLLPFHKTHDGKNNSWKFVEVEILELSGSDSSRFSVLKIVDLLSRVVHFFDMEDKKPEYIAKVLQSVFMRYGLPRLIRFLNLDHPLVEDTIACLRAEILAFEECINLVHQSIQDLPLISQGMNFKIEPSFSKTDTGSVHDYLEDGWKKEDMNKEYVWKMYVIMADRSLLEEETHSKYIDALIKFLSMFSNCWKEWTPLLSFCMQTVVDLSTAEKVVGKSGSKVSRYITAIVGPPEGNSTFATRSTSTPSVASVETALKKELSSTDKPKRGRGRPRKRPLVTTPSGPPPPNETLEDKVPDEGNKSETTQPPKKRGRGRPRKVLPAPSDPDKEDAEENKELDKKKLDGGSNDQEQHSNYEKVPSKRYSFREVLKPRVQSKFIKYFLSNCSSRRSASDATCKQASKATQSDGEEESNNVKGIGGAVIVMNENNDVRVLDSVELKEATVTLKPLQEIPIETLQDSSKSPADSENAPIVIELDTSADELEPEDDLSVNTDERIERDVERTVNALVASVVENLGEEEQEILLETAPDDSNSLNIEIFAEEQGYGDEDSDPMYDPANDSMDSSEDEPQDSDSTYEEGKSVILPGKAKVSRSKHTRKARRSGNLPVKCPFCLKTFVSSREELQFHLKFHKIGVSGLVCPACGRNERSWVHMGKHIGKHRELKLERFKCIKQFTKRCPKCDREFSTSENLISHFENKHKSDESSYTCSLCYETFTNARSYVEHCGTHEAVAYECDKCSFVTYKKSKFESHKQSHENASYKCIECNRSFRTETGLTIHLARDKHTSKERSLCEECGCSFTSVYYLKMHNKRLHQESESHPCPHCPYVGTLLCNLKQHIERTHVKEFSCDQCEYATKKERSLLRHKAAFHDKTRTAVCSHCGYRGPSRKHVTEHIRMQHNPGLHRFACQQCSLTFKTMTQLRDHMPSHTGETPYACKICGYRCKYRQTMHMHVKKRHPGVSIREGIEGPRDRRDRCDQRKKSASGVPRGGRVAEFITDSILQEGPEVSVVTDSNGFTVEETIAAVNSTGQTIYMDGDPLNIDGVKYNIDTYKIVQGAEQVAAIDNMEPGVEILLLSLNPTEEQS